MLRKTTASVLTVVPATKPKMNDGSDGKKSGGGLTAASSHPPSLWSFAKPHLATRAEVGGAAADDDADERRAAARAILPLAGVDEELVLHRALLAAGVAVVVDRGAAGLDPGRKGGDDRVAQRLGVLRLERAGGRERGQLGAEERLVGVDVADPRHLRLVEQE